MVAIPASARSLAEALHSDGPASDRAEKLRLYAWLVGRWEMDVVIHENDGSQRLMKGMVFAGWVLEGRAIQHVFAVPGLFYGTTLRIFDPSLDAWRILWSDPLNQVYCNQIGRARGADIVQEGKEPPNLARLYGSVPPEGSEAIIRWSFTDIEADRFRWLSERSIDGVSWTLQREYFAWRV